MITFCYGVNFDVEFAAHFLKYSSILTSLVYHDNDAKAKGEENAFHEEMCEIWGLFALSPLAYDKLCHITHSVKEARISALCCNLSRHPNID